MATEIKGTLRTIPRSSIVVPERMRVDYGDITSLVATIKDEGLINPLTFRDLNDGTFQLACGGRRLRAIDTLEWDEIPANIFPFDTDDLTFRILELKENLERKDYTWHEVVASKAEIHRLMVMKYGGKTTNSRDGHSLRDTAKMLNESPVNLSRDLDLARKIEAMPILKNYDNKAGAVKALDMAGKRVQTSEQLKVLMEEQRERPEDLLKQKLVDCYVLGDFFDKIKSFPSEYFDFVDLDPPYGIGFDSPGSARAQEHLRADFKEVEGEDYPKLIARILEECYRVMKPHSWIVVWYAADPWADTTYRAIINAGFMCSRYNGIWKKGIQKGFAPDLRGRFSQSYEPFYYARKGDPGFNITGRYAIFDYEPTPPSEKIHPTEKPIELMNEILRTFTLNGANVLVPFAGSGNTLLSANNYKCSAIGFDLSKTYKESFSVRVLEGTLGDYK